MGLKEMSRDARFAAGLLARRPFQCLIQVTNRCNMRCSFCDFWPNGVAPREELTLADYRKLAAELARISCFLISVEGGEPFVRPDIIDIVRIFGERHIPVLYTNGWYIDDDAARGLFAAGVSNVGVSIDYPDAERHDRKRGLKGTFDRALRAVERLRRAAPHGGKQVHVMTVLMKDNQRDLEPLLRLSRELGVGHNLTLLSVKGFRRSARDEVDEWPEGPLTEDLLRLWERYPHLTVFRDYLERMDPFLASGPMPRCRAGEQSFNVDHLGNVAPCIEKIDRIIGNVRDEPLARILDRMKGMDEVARCQDCWTLCRGFNQAMGAGGSLGSWRDLATRMRAT